MKERKRNVKWEIIFRIKPTLSSATQMRGNFSVLTKKPSWLQESVISLCLSFITILQSKQVLCKNILLWFSIFLHKTTLIMWCKGWLSIQMGISCLKRWLIFTWSPEERWKFRTSVCYSEPQWPTQTQIGAKHKPTDEKFRKRFEIGTCKSISLSQYKLNNNNDYNVILARWVNAGLWG